MSASDVAFTVVIVTWNSAAEIVDAVRSAAAQGATVVVIDNASDDGSAAVAREAGADLVIETGSNLGFGRGCNVGLDYVQTEFVLFLNPDARLQTGALEALLDFFMGHPEASIAGPAILDERGRLTRSAGRAWTLWTEVANKTLTHRLARPLRGTRRVGWVTGAALAGRTADVRHLGAFDPEIFLYYEDLDLCARARETGMTIWFTDDARVTHLGKRSSRQVEAAALVASQTSAERYWRRHGGRFHEAAFRALTLPEMVLRSVIWTVMLLIPTRRSRARARLAAYRRIVAGISGKTRARVPPAELRAGPNDAIAPAEPLVSVIIATYNRAHEVGRAVESVLAQDYRPLEIIVVDDGSTDDTQAVLEAYRDPVRIIRQENRERGAARNAGLSASSGELVCFLDSDDELRPGHLPALVRGLTRNPTVSVAYGLSEFHDDDRGSIFDVFPRRPVEGDAFLASAKGNRITIGSALVRRKLLDLAGAFDEDRQLSGGEDWEFWTRCLAVTPVAFVPEARVRIHFHSGNTVGDPAAMERAYRSASAKILDHPLTRDRLAKHRRRLRAGLWSLLAHHHMLVGDTRTARARLREGFGEDPGVALTWVWWSMAIKSVLGSDLVGRLRSLRRGAHLRRRNGDVREAA